MTRLPGKTLGCCPTVARTRRRRGAQSLDARSCSPSTCANLHNCGTRKRQTVVASYGTGPSHGAALSSDGRHVVSLEYVKASTSHRVSVWDAATGRLLQRSEAVAHDASMAGFAGTDSGHVVFFAIQKDAPRWSSCHGTGARDPVPLAH
jgi:hypothetical protein